MNRFLVAAFAIVACAQGAPSGYGTIASAPVAVGQTHHTYAAGPPVVQQHVEYGVVGHQTVQTGVQRVQAGHQYIQAGQEVIPQAAVSYTVSAPQTHVETVPLPTPAIPAAAPAAAIPPAPRNLGPAPADTVTQQRILAPVRSHTVITPQQTNIVPQLQVNKYAVDVPVQVPVPVEREVVVTKQVAKPYTVEVPRPVPVEVPYKVHPVQEIVEQPHVHTATYTTHSAQTVVAAAPAVAHAGYAAVAAPAVAHAGYAAVAAPAIAHAGYAAAPALAHSGYATLA